MDHNINFENFQPFPVFESERLLFRAMDILDAEVFYKMRSNPTLMEYMDAPHHKSKADSLKQIQKNLEGHKKMEELNWAICKKEQPKLMIGYFGLWKIDKEHKRGEIGYALTPEHWRKGYLTETMRTTLPFVFQKLNFHSISANVNTENVASQKLLEKIGFQKEAFFRENYFFDGQFLDSLIYGLLEKDLKL